MFLGFTQRVVVISYRWFRTACRSHLQGSRIHPWIESEDGTDI